MAFTRYITKHSQGLAAFGIGTLFVGSITPQMLGLNKYREMLAQHKDGEVEALTETLTERTLKVLDQIKLKVAEEVGLEFFPAYGNDMIHKGSVKLRTGAVIGIPSSFNFTSEDQVKQQGFQVGLNHVDWDSPGGEQLMHALVLTPKAKDFAIAREVYYTNTHHLWMNSFLMTAFGGIAFTAAFATNRLFHLHTRMKRWGRVGFYGTVVFIALSSYVIMSDAYMCSRDNKVDKWAGLLSQDFAEGGVEYYSKLLQRNQALRKIMGAEGATYYTLFGNEVATWRRPHIQLTQRKDNLIKLLKSDETKE